MSKMSQKNEEREARTKELLFKNMIDFRESLQEVGSDQEKLDAEILNRLYSLTASFLLFAVARHPELAKMRTLDLIETLAEAEKIRWEEMFDRYVAAEYAQLEASLKIPAAKKSPANKPTKKGAK